MNSDKETKEFSLIGEHGLLVKFNLNEINVGIDLNERLPDDLTESSQEILMSENYSKFGRQNNPTLTEYQ